MKTKQEEIKERYSRWEITMDKALQELWKFNRSRMKDYVKTDY